MLYSRAAALGLIGPARPPVLPTSSSSRLEHPITVSLFFDNSGPPLENPPRMDALLPADRERSSGIAPVIPDIYPALLFGDGTHRIAARAKRSPRIIDDLPQATGCGWPRL